MPTLTITRGLPGSGKTTWARAQVGTARVNRDDLRRMMHGGMVGQGWAEVQVNLAQRAQVEALLTAGLNVICDDTNLRGSVVRELAELGLRCGAEIVIRDFTDVPLSVCLERDAGRPESVGEDVIRDMYRRYLAGRSLPLPVPEIRTPIAGARYVPPDGAPRAVLVDIDGRPEQCRVDTLAWLDQHVGVAHDGLHLRADGDERRDSVVKAEIFEREIRHRYVVVGVFDDRAQVVRMWRALGLTVFHVAYGDF